MLHTIKQYIDTLSDLSFSQYYQQYINNVQDYTLGQEVKDLRNADILSIDRLIAKLMKEVDEDVRL
jgi:hypothetical protein